MINWLIPTQQNNYRARLLSIPALTVIMLGLLLVNSVAGIGPVRTVQAAISADQILQAHNEERDKAGLGQLSYSSVLSNSAQRKAQAMLENDCWSHYCPDGKSPWEFFTESGYEYLYAGENLAEGFATINSLMVAWMNSPTHRDNILRGSYTQIGIGMVTGTFQGRANSTVIAVHFGTPVGSDIQVAAEIESSIPAPQITFPQNGSAFNFEQLQISGITDLSTDLINLYNNSEPWAEVSPNQGIFTYNARLLEQGDYRIQAQATQGSLQSALSDTVRFTIDNEPNPIRLSQFTFLQSDTNSVTLQVTEPAISSLELTHQSGVTLEFEQVSNVLWELKLDPQLLVPGFELLSADIAGNEWVGQFSDAQVRAEISTSVTAEDIVDSSILRSQINGTVLIFLVLMFLIDLVVLNRTGQTKQSRRSNMHVALLLIVGIVILTGTFVGQVGQGINT